MPGQPESVRTRGRRAGGEGARDQIVAGARLEFAENGYDATSLRAIARRAGVDPALVRYYFRGGKAEVFAAAVARRDVNPQKVAVELIGGGVEGLGERVVLGILTLWDAPGGRDSFRLVVAAAASGNEVLLREFLTREIVDRISAAIGGPDAQLRAALAASQLAGLLVARHVIGLEPVASATVEELGRIVGPVVQRYFDGPGVG